jgi:hypothetical protein
MMLMRDGLPWCSGGLIETFEALARSVIGS